MDRFKKGFTIIELSVSIVVIGILIGLSVFSFSKFRSRNIFYSKINGIRSLYIRINKKAVTSGKDCQLLIDKSNNVILGMQNGSVIQGDSIFLDPNRFSINMSPTTLTFTITPGGVANTSDTVRTFSITDTKSGIGKSIFISPLGVMEVK